MGTRMGAEGMGTPMYTEIVRIWDGVVRVVATGMGTRSRLRREREERGE